MKPREFWINKGAYNGDDNKEPFYSCIMDEAERNFTVTEYQNDISHFVHVIEKRAYDELMQKLQYERTTCEILIEKNDELEARLKVAEDRLVKLELLESYGVDNWEWYGDAMSELEIIRGSK